MKVFEAEDAARGEERAGGCGVEGRVPASASLAAHAAEAASSSWEERAWEARDDSD